MTAPFDGDSTDSRAGRIRIRPVGTGRACLIRMSGSFLGETFLIEPGTELVVGRGAGNDMRLPFPDVSRVHARLTCSRSGKVELSDLGSTNGTFVNGQKRLYRVLREGDKIQFGETSLFRFAFHDEVDEEFQTRLFGTPLLDRVSNTLTRDRLIQVLSEAHAAATASGGDLALIVLGIDGFDLLEDFLGVAVRDYFLREISWRVRKAVSGEATLYRVAAGSFATLLPGASRAQAMGLAERMRAAVANARLPHEGDEMAFSMAVGACFLGEDAPSGSDAMLALAESRCRLAMEAGGDRVVAAEA